MQGTWLDARCHAPSKDLQRGAVNSNRIKEEKRKEDPACRVRVKKSRKRGGNVESAVASGGGHDTEGHELPFRRVEGVGGKGKTAGIQMKRKTGKPLDLDQGGLENNRRVINRD